MTEVPGMFGHLPVDPVRQIPVPYAQFVDENGEADFTRLDPVKQAMCGRLRLCGVCGRQMGYWVAFIGGPASAASRVYLDPPMHEECALASVQMCPHMARKRVPRRPVADQSYTPPGFVEGKPDQIAVLVVRTYRMFLQGRAPAFKTPPPHRMYLYSYDERGRVSEPEEIRT